MDEKEVKKQETAEKSETLGKGAEKVTRAVTGLAKETATRTAAALEATGEKAAAAKDKAAAAIAETGRRAADATKKTAAVLEETGRKAASAKNRAAAAIIPEVYVQWGGLEWNCADVLERAKADFRANNRGGVHTCRIYIKPEDGVAYYVISGKEGKISL